MFRFAYDTNTTSPLSPNLPHRAHATCTKLQQTGTGGNCRRVGKAPWQSVACIVGTSPTRCAPRDRAQAIRPVDSDIQPVRANILDSVLVGDSGNVEARYGTVVDHPYVVTDFYQIGNRILEGKVLSAVPGNGGCE